VTSVGEWGKWIVGGGWLSVGGRKVDFLYRDGERVAEVVAACRTGHITIDYQPGHPHGFCSAIWMGEVALCQPLFDPQGMIAELKAMTSPYPEALREALSAASSGKSCSASKTPKSRYRGVSKLTYRAACTGRFAAWDRYCSLSIAAT
jgi:hypothetical protein